MAFGLFKKKKKEKDVKNTKDKYLNLTVKEVIKETDKAVSVVFDTNAEKMPYEAGQFVTLIETINGQKIRRAYSLCTSPFVDEFPAVTVKRVAGGAMSNHVNDTLLAGAQVEVMEPMGQFTTDYKSDRKRHLVLFAGGSGITPLMAITKSVLFEEPQSIVSLVYANESESEIIFAESLKELKDQYSDRLIVVHVLNNPPENWDGHSGWMSVDKVKTIIEELPKLDATVTEFFTCGPGPMMDIVVEGLESTGVAKDHIKLESFEAGKTSPKEIFGDASVTEGVAQPVKVIIDDEEFNFDVPADKTILEQGLEENVDMPYSCQSGLCTACRGKLHSGKVKMIEYDGLSQSEIDDGYVLCCQAYAETDDVVIEIG
ncbi:MAG: ferredoxin--NADP reductase [Bacteroidota bacterium]